MDSGLCAGLPSENRGRELICGLMKVIHQYFKDVRLTTEEFEIVLDAIKRASEISVGGRDEFRLIADVLGLSTLLVDLNTDHTIESEPTDNTVLGPFYNHAHPLRNFGDNIYLHYKEGAVPCLYRGFVYCAQTKQKIEEATIDVWLTDIDGHYDVQQKGQN
jgi:hydroxyquinol 1,2-dioxygenase